MLESPSHAIAGSSDPEATARFLGLFGFEVTARGELGAAAAGALYGLDAPASEWHLAVAGAARGGMRLVATPLPARETATLDHRAFAIDLYTRDVARSLSVAAAAGHAVSPVAEHRFGPMVVKEAEVHGPDRLVLTLLELAARRPSLLDTEPGRLHSELHSFVWSVADAGAAARFWEERAGLKKITDATLGGKSLALTLGIDDREVNARLVVFCDEASRPVRLQLIQFLGEPGKAVASFPLAAGLHALAFDVPDLEAATRELEGARFGEPVTVERSGGKRARAVAGAAPGDLRFELWQAL